MNNKNFNQFNLSDEFVSNLQRLGYTHTTPIQEKSLSYILAKKDIIAKAKTGSGKTLAFAIGVVSSLDLSSMKHQSLIISPTRELASQLSQEIKKVAKYRQNIKVTLLVGGKPLKQQIDALAKGTHIIVATPGRLLDHLEKETLSIKSIKTLVIDEADKLLDMGFLEDIQKIVRNMSQNRHTMLFSATFDSSIYALSKEIQKSAITIETDSKVDKLQEFYIVSDDKYTTLKEILTHYKPNKCVIFRTTKLDVEELADRLFDDRYSESTLQGDMDQYARDEALLKFSNSSTNLLVATDLASRGLDIDGVDLVINYDYPKDITQYTHRVGRTGRMNKSGIAITLLKPIDKLTTELQNRQMDKLELHVDKIVPYEAPMNTLIIKKYRKNKIRAGDIVGTLTKTKEISGEDIGDISITDQYAYVAIKNSLSAKAFEILQSNKIKGIKFKIYRLN